LNERDEHYFSLLWLEGIIEFHNIRTVLDIGAGTGRVARFLKSRNPELKITSLEPVRELREVGHANGLSRDDLIDGDATKLAFQSGAFDLVCEFGILHHVKHPEAAVNEMLRVAKVGIFISDSNNFGQGSYISRTIKQLINAVGLWKLTDLIKTKGKGYSISEGDGLYYSYSVFDNYKDIKRQCKTHILNTVGAGINPYKSASHVALLGIKI
jgi:ubiquinone/menaquinone biosynthesis C-methylase UbiE